jgi:hypothetical protein
VKTLSNRKGFQTTVTLMGVKHDPLPDSDFVAPTDYQFLDMPKLLDDSKAPPSGARS